MLLRALLIYPVVGNYYSGSYPSVGSTTLDIGHSKVLIKSYIDSGASTRVFTGVPIGEKKNGLPAEVALKCMYTTNKHLQKKIQHEYDVLEQLGSYPDLHIPRVYFLSTQWSCGGSHKCQFLMMTKAGPDFDRLVTRNTFGLSKAVQRGKPGQFELFVASVGLCVIVELEKLHKAGAIHGDIGRYNVANDLTAHNEVMLIDFGQGKLKSELSDSEFRRGMQRDFRRTNAFVLRLLKTKLGLDYGWSSENHFKSNPLFSRVSGITDDESDLKKSLLDFIESEYGKSFSGKIMT